MASYLCKIKYKNGNTMSICNLDVALIEDNFITLKGTEQNGDRFIIKEQTSKIEDVIVRKVKN